MKNAGAIFSFLQEAAARGEQTALVTLTGVTASAVRSPGEHIAVAKDGSFVGSFSGGCIEAAIVSEAIEAMAAGCPRSVRYGAGSPFIDIRLPCGGGIDLLIIPAPETPLVERAIDLIKRRRPVAVTMTTDGLQDVGVACADDNSGWQDEAFVACHHPDLRLVIIGDGAESAALLRIGNAYGAETQLLSPDRALVASCLAAGGSASLLTIRGTRADMAVDPWTAVVMLFHDHDWETDLLVQALSAGPMYVGAMGSRRTHLERCERLAAVGVEDGAIRQIKGPIGIIPASRDPDTLAISILAQVVSNTARHGPVGHD